jgi:hypothetical protein
MSDTFHTSSSASAIPRRAFLAASGLAVAGTAAAPLFGPRTAAAHAEDCSCLTAWAGIWSVARAGAQYFALAGEVDAGTLEIHKLTVAADARVSLGEHRTVDFPDRFVPATLHGFGERLLVGGGVLEDADRISVDYTADPAVLASEYLIGYRPPVDSGVVDVPLTTVRPALFEVVGRQLREIPLGDSVKGLGWGVVTDLATVSATGLAVRVEGSTTYEEAYGSQIVVAETADGGRTWSGTTLVTALGEAWLGALTVRDGVLLAVAVDQENRRTVFQRPAQGRTPWLAADVGPDGRVLGTVAGRNGLVVFDAKGDRIRRRQYSPVTRGWLGSPVDARVTGKPTHAVLTIGGAPYEWIAIDATDARLVNEA